MLEVPIFRQQTAYNCGTYSLWMAIESLTDENPALITKIEQQAKMYSDSMGGLFNPVHMEKIITEMGYSPRRVRFHDGQSLLDGLRNHNDDAILMAYSFDILLGGNNHPPEPGNSAHWSVLTRWNGNIHIPQAEQYQPDSMVALANPHGREENVEAGQLLAANLALDGATFNWRNFVQDFSLNDAARFQRALSLYKNDAGELTKRGRSKVYLGRYFIAISQ